MRLTGLLSWFDEPKDALILCVDGLAKAGASHLVAVDGRYALFPSRLDRSPAEQCAWLDAACRHHGMGLTLHVPDGPWQDGEREKRTFMFGLALAVSDPGDWWMIQDADMPITQSPPDLLDRLAATEHEAAMIRLHDVVAERIKRADHPPNSPFRGLYRAHPMACGWAHWRYYSLADGHDMWRGTDPNGLPEPLDLYGEMTIEHRAHARGAARDLLKNQYYTRRDTLGIEMGKCPRCDDQGTVRMKVIDKIITIADPKPDQPPRYPVGHVEEVCEAHAREMERRNRVKLRQWGLPPDLPIRESYALPEQRGVRTA